MTMDPKDPRRLAEEAEFLASQKTELASGLSDRVASIEKWLIDRGGRAAIQTSLTDGSCRYVLKFERTKGKNRSWRLLLERRSESPFAGMYGPDTSSHSGLLVDAPVRLKLVAVRMFPDLLSELVAHHQEDVDALKEAHVDLDRLYQSLGIGEQAEEATEDAEDN